MAVKRTRRTTKRRGSSSRAKGSNSKSSILEHSWVNEAFSVCFAALSLILICSILSLKLGYLEGDYQSARGNWMGPVGHLVATLLTGWFGWSSLVLSLWFAWLTYYFWTYDERPKKSHGRTPLIIGLVGILICACAFGSLIFGKTFGGALGSLLSDPLNRMLGKVGASVITAALLLVSVALATRSSVGTILSNLIKTSWVLLWDGALKGTMFISGYLWDGVLFVYDTVFDWVGTAADGVGEFRSRRKKKKSEKRDIPIPTKRTNVINEDDFDDELQDDDVRDVIVKRAAKAKRTSIKEFQQARKERLEKERLNASQEAEDLQNYFENYEPPDIGLLTESKTSITSEDDELLKQKSILIEEKLRDFSIKGRVTQIHPGPVITLFEFEPAAGVKVGKIASLQDDLAMGLRASSIRIIAPIPRRGTVGIEVPNKNRDIVRLRDVLQSEEFVDNDSLLTVPIGKDTSGAPAFADVSRMPHLLMAGATGTGKSVCINAVLLSLLYRATPEELGLILIDPKILELSVYEGVPHLRVPVVTVPKQAKAVLQWAIDEMNRRYKVMQRYGVRSIDGFNAVVKGEEEADFGEVNQLIELTEETIIEPGMTEEADLNEDKVNNRIVEQLRPLPKIVIVIDELADLMLSVGRDIEELITRLAQKARAAGIHLIVATQRPSVDVITGLIKANFPARISFRVSSRIDSRTILDSGGAEKLLGRGDMLFMPPGAEAVQRIHGAYVSDSEVKRVIKFLKKNCEPHYDEQIMNLCEQAMLEEESKGGDGFDGEPEFDAYYDRAVELVVQKGQASTSMLQRAFRIGYNRAARIIDSMEHEGVVGPMDGSKPRRVLLVANEE